MYRIPIISLLFFFVINGAFAQVENISVHDPCIIKQDSVYHIFCTGRGITHWYSTDLQHWYKGKPVFDRPPVWADSVAPHFDNHIWAPDISFHNGIYYLYYSVSAFGKNTSAIGLATNTTLDERDPNYHWTDHGIVVRSVPGRDMWNAIDPNLIVDKDGTPWLDFGSFWDGIKMVQLTSDYRSVATPSKWYTLASRKRTFGIADTLPGDGAIEGAFVFRHDKYYYLFVSFDYCCRGVRSNYKMMVGRSESVTGPYLDKEGTPMIKGGGSLLLAGDKHWPGVGHNAILSDEGRDFLVFHGYDATDHGIPRLRILPIQWVDEWPLVKDNDSSIIFQKNN